MINFRFHLVSLTAVFLALAAGIAIGAGVVDRQTVGFLEDRLAAVERNREETNALNEQLERELSRWAQFSSQAGDRLVEGRLVDMPVVLFSVEGTDRNLVASVRETVEAAGASVQGSVWLTDRWLLDDEADVTTLAEIGNASATTPHADLRGLVVGRLVSTWLAGSLAEVVIPLRDAGFLEYDPPPGRERALDEVAMATSAVVVVADANAAVANADLALPLTRTAVAAGLDVLAAQPAAPAPARDDDPIAPGLAVLVRRDDATRGVTTTVDNVEDHRGRIAVVFALAELRQGRNGHYGVGEGADRLLPEPAG